MHTKKLIPVILGPTSTGKTSLALKLCKEFNADILSVDSRQVFKHMDIGTGKLPIKSPATYSKNDNKWFIDDVSVWGYDLATPDQYFSAHDFTTFALNTAREVLLQKNLFLVGGTGFYIDLLTGRLKPAGIKPDFTLRTQLETLDPTELYSMLELLNPTRAAMTDRNNKPRLVRAIEIEKNTKATLTSLPYLSNVEFKFIGLTASRDVLYNRADAWTEDIWVNGLVSETKYLLDLGYGKERPLHGLIYKDVLSFLSGDISQVEAIQKNKFALHAYIRRQQTWFKKNGDIEWFDISVPDTLTNLRELLTRFLPAL